MVGSQDFEKALTPRRLLPLAMIPGSMAAGILVTVGLAAFFHSGSPLEPSENALRTARVFSLCHAALASVLFYVSSLLPERLLARDKVRGAQTGEALVGMYQTAMILRFALAEAAALLGCVVCILAAMGGVLRVQPLYALNLLSAAVFFWILLSHWPGAERLKEWHRSSLV